MRINTVGIKGFIFDLDGVVVDTRPYHFAAWKKLGRQFGVEIDRHHNEILRGLSRMKSLELLMEWGNIYASEAEKLYWADVKNSWYIEMIAQMRPEEVLPGVRQFLRDTQDNGIKMALVSSSRNAQTVLRSVDLSHFFEVVIDGTVSKKSKPSPDCFLLAAAGLGLQPTECLVFEDAPVGIAAARSGGFKSVAVGSDCPTCPWDFVIDGFENIVVMDIESLGV